MGVDVATIAEVAKSHPENRMAKHFTDEYYNSLPEEKQKLLLLCCKSGIENADSGMGLYAMSPTDYDDFKPYFDKVPIECDEAGYISSRVGNKVIIAVNVLFQLMLL